MKELNEVIDDLWRRAESCAQLADQKTDPVDVARCRGKALAYSHAADLVSDLRSKSREEELEAALRWYVENDETNEGGHWEEDNAPWLEGKRRAMKLLGMSES